MAAAVTVYDTRQQENVTAVAAGMAKERGASRAERQRPAAPGRRTRCPMTDPRIATTQNAQVRIRSLHDVPGDGSYYGGAEMGDR